ncbi:uncharacterized protein K02A2.6-like [Cydia amplana]|uniref:uncharacterized protein K02A2.6-like n=1 Tax=Cydia amplana TaxID=1869771 RepID=UPI002FE64E73
MSKKLSDIPNTAVFIDNIYISGKDLQDTVDTLSKVLERLQQSEFKLKIQKCKFFENSIDVFGFTIDSNGIRVNKDNIKPLLQATPPINVTMLRSFLGKVNYYSRFLKDMASILTPLYECTKENKFNWTHQCDNAFVMIKNKLANMENLTHYDPNLPLILSCDASDTGLAAVISNRDRNGVVKPIAYASRKLNETEIKYSTIDKEAMAVVFGVTKFYNYTYGRSFELETDSAALVRIFGPTKAIPKMAAKRLQHYAIFLSAFNYKIRHIKTDKNPADFLSRTPMLINENTDSMHPICTDAEISNIYYIQNCEIENLDWKSIQEATRKDVTLAKIIRYTMDGWPDLVTEKELSTYGNKKTEISFDRGCLFWGYRIIIPESLRQAILLELHKSHFGTVRMKQLARSYFWWPGIDAEIEKITNDCLTCLSVRNNPTKGHQKSWPVAPSVWYRIHADYCGPFYNKMYLVVVDSYSKWPEVIEMNSITSSRTIEVFNSLFARHGYPVHLVTDNGPSFTSSEFKDFCKLKDIKHTFTPPYHPATNGAAERFVDIFKKHVLKIKESRGNTIQSAINLFLFDYRVTPHSTTGVTPASLIYNRDLRSRFALLRPPPVIERAQHMLEKQREQASGSRNIEFMVGEKVMVKDYRKNRQPWIQGVIVEESIPNTTYIIDVEGCKWKRHVNQMLNCSLSLLE